MTLSCGVASASSIESKRTMRSSSSSSSSSTQRASRRQPCSRCGCASLRERARWPSVIGRAASSAASAQQQEQQQDHEAVTRSLPRTYRRWAARRPAESFRAAAQMEEAELQLPGPGEVLVRVQWAGINGGCETFRARAEHAFTLPAQGAQGAAVPLGAEGAGVIAAVGPGVSPKLKVGVPVAFNGGHAFSEFCVLRDRLATPLPLSAAAAGAAQGPEGAVLTLSGMTAICALEGVAKIKPGEVVAVTAAAGGTGHLAVQVALLAGCHVVAICGDERKAQALRGLRLAAAAKHGGSLTVINRTTQDVDAELRQLAERLRQQRGAAAAAAGGQAEGCVDVVYEGVGGALRQVLLRHLAPGGRFLQVGYISEYPHAQGHSPLHTVACSPAPAAGTPLQPQPGAAGARGEEAWWGVCDDTASTLPPPSELFWDGVDVCDLPGGRQVLGRVWPQDAKTLLRCRSRLFDLHYAQGALEVWTDASIRGLERIPDAVEHMLRGQHVGKVVVRIAEGP